MDYKAHTRLKMVMKVQPHWIACHTVKSCMTFADAPLRLMFIVVTTWSDGTSVTAADKRHYAGAS
jgi:hypothetical protein